MSRDSTRRKSKLVYVVHSLDPGGTERLAFDMAVAYASEYSVCVVCLDKPGAWAQDLRKHGIVVECVWRSPGLDPKTAIRLGRIFRREQADIVHAHQCAPWFYAALARLSFGRPKLLLEEHGRLYPEAEKPVRRFINRWLVAPLTHRFVAVSEEVRDRLVRYEGLSHDRIEVVYNGASPAPALEAERRTTLRQHFGFEDDDFVIGTVGRLDPIKNLPMLIRSIAELHTEFARLRVLIVGDGPVRDELESSVQQYGLENVVRMAGFRSDARQLAACLETFVLCSFSEGTSMALLEAMAAGVPAVVTKVGGNPELIADELTGRVVPSDDTSALTAALRKNIDDRDSAIKMAAAARQRFDERFSFSAMLDRYRSFYTQMLRTHADASA